MSKLDLDLYEVEGMSEGEQRHFNHKDCHAGTDTKRRLYIKRIEDGYIYYCHHCGVRGCVSKNLARYHAAKSKGGLRKGATSTGSTNDGGHVHRTKAKGYSIPRDAVRYSRENWPIEARRWVMQYGIKEKELEHYNISYSPYYKRVVLPAFGPDGVLVFQLRKLFSEDERKPKYLTYRNVSGGVYFPAISGASDTVVVVEDYLSGIKVARHSDVYVLLGTYLGAEGLYTIIKREYKKAFVWLDDDNREVKRQQIVLKNQLALAVGDENAVVVHTQGRDPKDHSDAEIIAILRS